MKFNVTFSENSTSVPVAMSSNPKVIKSDLGITNVLHDGQNGATFIPAVSDDGVISWTNDKGLENPAPVNIKGEKGDDGYKPVKGVDYFTEEDIEETASRAAELVSIKTDNTLRIDESGVLSVNTTSQMEQDNTLPMTSAGVYATVGNIEALLKTI